MPSLFLKKGRSAPLKGDAGPLIGLLKLGLALATAGVVSKLAHKVAGPGPRAGFGGSNFAGPTVNRPQTAASAYGNQGPTSFRTGPGTPRPRQ